MGKKKKHFLFLMQEMRVKTQNGGSYLGSLYFLSWENTQGHVVQTLIISPTQNTGTKCEISGLPVFHLYPLRVFSFLTSQRRRQVQTALFCLLILVSQHLKEGGGRGAVCCGVSAYFLVLISESGSSNIYYFLFPCLLSISPASAPVVTPRCLQNTCKSFFMISGTPITRTLLFQHIYSCDVMCLQM
jgi:hypothetical protein